jgi:hypothetical protein
MAPIEKGVWMGRDAVPLHFHPHITETFEVLCGLERE